MRKNLTLYKTKKGYYGIMTESLIFKTVAEVEKFIEKQGLKKAKGAKNQVYNLDEIIL